MVITSEALNANDMYNCEATEENVEDASDEAEACEESQNAKYLSSNMSEPRDLPM